MISEEEEKKRRQLYDMELFDSEIAGILGVPTKTIKSWRTRRNLPANRARGRPSGTGTEDRDDVAKEKAARRENMRHLNEDAATAKKAGLSYGKWRALMQMAEENR